MTETPEKVGSRTDQDGRAEWMTMTLIMSIAETLLWERLWMTTLTLQPQLFQD
jgi:hypothetical protein